jgi:hypothetical protein
MVDMTYSTQYVREAPEIEAYKLGLINEARELYNQPMDLPAVEAAALSGTELQGIDFAKQGVGAFEPYIQAASQGVTQGMDLTQRGALAAGAIDTAPVSSRSGHDGPRSPCHRSRHWRYLRLCSGV